MGGAGRVSERITQILREVGFDAHLLYKTNKSLKRGNLLSHLRVKTLTIIDNHIVKKSQWASHFSLFRDRIGSDVSQIESYDGLVIRGVNGFFKLEEILALSSEKIWVVPDENFKTGGCHFTLGCEIYKQGCTPCPAVRRPFRKFVAANFRRKLNAQVKSSNLTYVAPNPGLMADIKNTRHADGKPCFTIPNPVRQEFEFQKRLPRQDSRVLRLLIVSEDLDDPVKGVGSFLDTLKQESADFVTSFFVSAVGSSSYLRGKHGKWVNFVGAKKALDLVKIMDESDFLVVPSLAESHGNTVAEAHSRQLKVVATRGYGPSSWLQENSVGTQIYETQKELVRSVLGGQFTEPKFDNKTETAYVNGKDIAELYGKLLRRG